MERNSWSDKMTNEKMLKNIGYTWHRKHQYIETDELVPGTRNCERKDKRKLSRGIRRLQII